MSTSFEDSSSLDEHEGVEWNGLEFTPVPLRRSVDLISALAMKGSARHLHLCNSWTVVLAERDLDLRRALEHESALNLVDGAPLARVLAATHGRPPQGTRGPSLFEAGVPELARNGARQLLFGATTENLAAITEHFQELGVREEQLFGHAPPYQPLTEEVIGDYVSVANSFAPDIVWVGLGTPKQDILAMHMAEQLEVPVVCVGAAFDFAAGSVPPTPRWLQNSGFEWVYRFAKEPRRLWRRYTWGNATFLRIVLRNKRSRAKS